MKTATAHAVFTGVDVMKSLDYDRNDGDAYNRFRRPPPKEVVAETLLLSGKKQFDLVVDLGCGTGLSAIVWEEYARQIIGIEPNKKFIEVARRENCLNNIEYIEAWSHGTGIKAGSADIVTAMNSLHWMELEPTFNEINRLLKPDGMFVTLGATDFTIYDFDANIRFHEIMDLAIELLKKNNLHKQSTIQAEEDLEIYFKNRELFSGRVEFSMRKREELLPADLSGRMKTIGFVESCMVHDLSGFKEKMTAFEKHLTNKYQGRKIPYSTNYEIKIGQKNI